MENNKIETVNNTTLDIINVIDRNTTYCSLDISTDEGKKLAFNTSSNPKYALKECVNKVIPMVGLYIEAVNMEQDSDNSVTGFESVVRLMPRMVIIDKNGESYACVSTGAYNAMRRIVTLFGAPNTWTKPLEIVPLLKNTKKGQVLTIELH